MKILTIKPPWAQAIIAGVKPVENRRTNLAGGYRGKIAVHAGRSFDRDAWLTPGPCRDWLARWYGWGDGDWGRDLVHGVIIGVVDLTDVHPVANPHFNPICHDLAEGLTAAAIRGGACSPWASTGGQWHLVLANPRPLSEPIPYRGALGLRALDAETTARVEAAIA